MKANRRYRLSLHIAIPVPARLSIQAVAAILLAGASVTTGHADDPSAPALQMIRGVATRFAPSDTSADVRRINAAVTGHWFDPEGAIRDGRLGGEGMRRQIVVARRLGPDGFHETLSSTEDLPRHPGESNRTIHVLRADSGSYRWTLGERFALGRGSVAEMLASYRHLFDRLTGTGCGRPVPLPVVSETLEGLARLTIRCQPSGDGALTTRTLQIAVDVARSPSRRHHAEVRRFVDKQVRPARLSLRLADAGGAAWMDLQMHDGTVTVTIRDLTDAASSALPSMLSVDVTTRKGPFRVGARDMVGTVSFQRETRYAGVSIRFTESPKWNLPFFVRPLLKTTLNHPFSNEGVRLTWGLGEDHGTVLGIRESVFSVRPNWLTSWLGTPVSDARTGITPPVAALIDSVLRALAQDLSAVLNPTR